MSKQVTQIETFVMHDGEDEKKIEELHAFMEKTDMIEVWDVQDNGISIWIIVGVSDVISIGEGFVSVRRAAK